MNRRWVFLMIALLLLLSACSSKNTLSEPAGSIPLGERKTVVVSVKTSNRFLETAVQKFEALHPDIKIEIKQYVTFSGTDDGFKLSDDLMNTEKYVQSVLTEAMSGKGADLIEMMDLPEDKFVDKKLLTNLDELMAVDSSFDKNQLYSNILESSRIDGGLYTMPTNFMLLMIAGDQELLKKANITVDDKTWTWEQLKAITKELKEQEGQDLYAFVGFPQDFVVSLFLEGSYREFVQDERSVHFDSEQFRMFMQNIKTMNDEGIISPEMDGSQKGLFSYMINNRVQSLLVNLVNPDTVILQMPTERGQSQGWMYKSSVKLGINSNSKVQQEAWEFLKFLVSEEMQSSAEMMGIPVHKGAADMMLQEAAQKIAQGETGNLQPGVVPTENAGQEVIPDAKFVEQQIQYAKTILEGAKVTSSIDKQVDSIIKEEVQSYFSGQKSAEDVSKLIQNRVMTYLNE